VTDGPESIVPLGCVWVEKNVKGMEWSTHTMTTPFCAANLSIVIGTVANHQASATAAAATRPIAGMRQYCLWDTRRVRRPTITAVRRY